jgi:hypothetical protein
LCGVGEVADIQFETKTDRELLLITAKEVNSLSEKLETTCKTIENQEKRFDKDEKNIVVLQEKVKSQRKVINTIVAAVVSVVVAIFGFIIKAIFFGSE